MIAPVFLLSASHLAPIDAPVIPGGAVVFANGRIIAVGTRASLRAQFPSALAEDLPGMILLPGLVNAHVHLELSDQLPGPPPASFVDWLINLMRQTFRDAAEMPPLVSRAVAIGVQQSLRFGVTTVGDISRHCAITRPLLRDGPLRVVSFGEIQAMAQRRSLLDHRFTAAADLSGESRALTVGVTPHAPYTVEAAGYERCLAFARDHHRPIATHLAENPEESVFLAEQTGPFRHLWEVGVNAWDNHVPRYIGGPIRFARDIGLLDYPTLLAHVNYCDDAELAILAAGQASVVYCPRTHAYFGHPPHRWRDMLARGINVAVGTDSCASSPDLNLLDDLRLLHRLAPEVAPARLWRMATLSAPRALQLDHELGSLTPGKRADFIAFPVSEIDPLRQLLENTAIPHRLWIEGKPHTQIPITKTA